MKFTIGDIIESKDETLIITDILSEDIYLWAPFPIVSDKIFVSSFEPKDIIEFENTFNLVK